MHPGDTGNSLPADAGHTLLQLQPLTLLRKWRVSGGVYREGRLLAPKVRWVIVTSHRSAHYYSQVLL